MNLAEAHSRLEEVAQAMRYINHLEFGAWCKTYPNVYDRVTNGPLSLSTTDSPMTRLVMNLQIELQLRTAEFLLAVNQ